MKKAPPIPDEIATEIVADTILREVMQVTQCRLEDPSPLLSHLVNQAEEIATANESFRRKLCGRRGLDWMYAFMRHWLAAELKRTHPTIFRRLPPRYAMGESDIAQSSTPWEFSQ